MNPVAAVPALIERSREVLLELAMQDAIVEDIEAFVETLLAHTTKIVIRHQLVSDGPELGPKRR